MLGEILKKKLIENKMSQKKLSEKMNVSKQTVNNWCNNKTKPDAEKMFLLSKILLIDIKELFS